MKKIAVETHTWLTNQKVEESVKVPMTFDPSLPE